MDTSIDTQTFTPTLELRSCISSYGIMKICCSGQRISRVKTFPFAIAGMSIGLKGSRLNYHNTDLNIFRKHVSSLMGHYPIESNNFISPESGVTIFVNISFTHEGLRKILGLPLRELYETNTDLGNLSIQDLDVLIDQLENSENEYRIVEYLNDYFLLKLRKTRQVKDPFVSSLFQKINNCHSLFSVHDLALEMNMHVRTLERYFNRDVGLSPKEFLRITRFIRLKSLITGNPGLHWSDLVVSCGFYDQAHLAHEIDKVTNMPLSNFVDLIRTIK